MKRVLRLARSARLSRPALVALVSLAGACRSGAEAVPEPSAPASAPATAMSAASTTAVPRGARDARDAGGSRGRVRLLAAPATGSVESAVKGALDEAAPEHRTLVVYVGAAWCEPCQHFHHAAEQGELDATFPDVTFLEFDLDRDRDRLASAGYVSKYIPLFALPTAAGAASGKQTEGAIKGDGAVDYIVPRLRAMLSR